MRAPTSSQQHLPIPVPCALIQRPESMPAHVIPYYVSHVLYTSHIYNKDHEQLLPSRNPQLAGARMSRMTSPTAFVLPPCTEAPAACAMDGRGRQTVGQTANRPTAGRTGRPTDRQTKKPDCTSENVQRLASHRGVLNQSHLPLASLKMAAKKGLHVPLCRPNRDPYVLLSPTAGVRTSRERRQSPRTAARTAARTG
jgi:hypothetical protein